MASLFRRLLPPTRQLLTASAATTSLSLKRMHTTGCQSNSFRIGFCTDVEGDSAFWERYVERSEVLERSPQGQLRLRDECHFVFGGDAVDKSDGDLQVLGDLVSLRKAYPGRVHLLVGNRDVNKMRLVQELSQAELSVPCKQVYFTHLVKTKPPGLEASAAERLKWILLHTMGSPDAFAFRHAELSRRLGKPATDEEVVQSYRELAAPGGLMSEYLSLAEIAVHYPEGVLFVHGAVDSNNAGVLPFADAPGALRLPLPEWCGRLNRFLESQMEEWQSGGCMAPGVWSEFGGWGGNGRGLMQYGMGTLPPQLTGGTIIPGSNPSVILRSWLKNGHPQTPSQDVQDFLRKSGVRAVLTGHQPHGDTAVIIRCADDLVIVSSDTSYSAHVLWGDHKETACVADASEKSTRGLASSEVIVDVAAGHVKNVRVTAVLSDQEALRAELAVDGSVPNFTGRETKDGWWVKGKTKAGWICSRGEGFTVLNSIRPTLAESDFVIASHKSSL